MNQPNAWCAALLTVLALSPSPGLAQAGQAAEVDRLAAEIEPTVIEYRRHFHQHPELGNREFETAKFVAAKLRKLGLEV